jgi:hypothetical protein
MVMSCFPTYPTVVRVMSPHQKESRNGHELLPHLPEVVRVMNPHKKESRNGHELLPHLPDSGEGHESPPEEV